MHLEFSVSVAACLEALARDAPSGRLSSAGRARSGLRSHQRLELVLAWCQGHAVDQHVPPDVTCCVLRAVDPDEGALTVISMHPEVKSAAEA